MLSISRIIDASPSEIFAVLRDPLVCPAHHPGHVLPAPGKTHVRDEPVVGEDRDEAYDYVDCSPFEFLDECYADRHSALDGDPAHIDCYQEVEHSDQDLGRGCGKIECSSE